MGDCFRFHEWIWNDPAVEIVRACNPEARRLVGQQGVVRNEVDRSRVVRRRAMFPAETVALEPSDGLGVGSEHDLLVLAQPPSQT